jgi:hypothetical protein
MVQDFQTHAMLTNVLLVAEHVNSPIVCLNRKILMHIFVWFFSDLE